MEILPKKFLQYAKESYDQSKKGNKEQELRELINAFNFIMKGFHSQIDKLVEYISEFKKPKIELVYFPDKFDFVKSSDIALPEQILLLNKLRNDLEHRYLVPSRNDVYFALGYLKILLEDADTFMKLPAKQVKTLIDKKLGLLIVKREKIFRKPWKSKIVAQRSLDSYMVQSKKFFYFYGKKPNSLTGEDANNYMRRIIDEDYPPRHIQQIEAIIAFLYKNVLNKKWVKNYKRPPISGEEPTQLYYTQIQKILKFAPTFRDQLIIRFIYNTGLKAGQMVKTKIEDIPKFNLPESELEDLKKYLTGRKKGPIFLSQYDVGLGQRGIERIFEIISKRCGRRVYSEMIRKSNPLIRHKRSGITTKNPRRPRFVLRKDHVISKKEFQLLLDKARNELKRYYIYFVYHFQLGSNQFINIKYEDIDFKKGLINVKPSKKHYKKDKVYLEKEVLDALKEYCKEYKYDKKKGKLFS